MIGSGMSRVLVLASQLQGFQQIIPLRYARKILIKGAIRESIRSIDHVHGVSGFPEIRVVQEKCKGAVSSSFRPPQPSAMGSEDLYQIRLLLFEPEQSLPRMTATLLHEIGHAIDYISADERGQGLSSESRVEWDEWRKVVDSSEHVRDLRRLAADPPSKLGVYPPEPDQFFRDVASRNLQITELWARSYAQYIAVQNHRADLILELRTISDVPDEDCPITRQWSDDDFSPICTAIDRLFEMLGWTQRLNLPGSHKPSFRSSRADTKAALPRSRGSGSSLISSR